MLEGVVICNNWFKLKGFEDDKLKETRMAEFFLDKVNLIPFFSFPKLFSKGFFPRVFEIRDCYLKGYLTLYNTIPTFNEPDKASF